MNFLSSNARVKPGVPARPYSLRCLAEAQINFYISAQMSLMMLPHCDLIISYSRPARGALNCVVHEGAAGGLGEAAVKSCRAYNYVYIYTQIYYMQICLRSRRLNRKDCHTHILQAACSGCMSRQKYSN